MVRRGEDVASSTLKFSWGATNKVAGIIDWRIMLKNAMQSFDRLNYEHVLNLKLEDAQNSRDSFLEHLDKFIEKNYGLSNLDGLKNEFDKSFKPIKSYPNRGIQGVLVKKLAQNTNADLGYDNHKIASSRDKVYFALALPFLFVDRAIRALKILKRKISF